MAKKIMDENYLERIPVRSPLIGFKADDTGIVTLEKENKGIFNRIAQKLFKRPKVSYIHLDAQGSFVWLLVDGKKRILDMADEVRAEFGEDAEPLYERLAKYIQILESYDFVSFK